MPIVVSLSFCRFARHAPALLFAALLQSTVVAAGEPLPSVLVQPQRVAGGFAVESTVEAVLQATVGSQVPGRVLEVRADAGQTVKKGELLARIDAREAEEAARAAEAQYRNAKANFERTQALVGQKFMSPAALDKARADLDTAAAQRSAASAGQSHATVVAPLAGIVARRHAEAGDMAMPGAPLFTIYQPGGLRVSASVPQHRLPQLRGQRGALVEFPELGRQVAVAAGAVQVLPTADAATHATTVRITLPAATEAMPGTFARVRFLSGEADKLTVPQAAVVRRGEVAAVYVQAADGRLTLRQLRLGEAQAGQEIEVLAGLTVGERVVTDPVRAAIQIRAGAK